LDALIPKSLSYTASTNLCLALRIVSLMSLLRSLLHFSTGALEAGC
jgi:hypothetical protein